MMAEEQTGDFFTFRSNRFQDSLSCGLQGLLLDKDLIDVTFICEGGHYVKAHKVVMGACSPYFRTMFSEHDSKHPTVVMPDVNIDHFQAILEFIYMGEVNVKASDTMEFLDTAEMLKIKGLTLMLQDDKDPVQVEEIPEIQGETVVGVLEEIITTEDTSPTMEIDDPLAVTLGEAERMSEASSKDSSFQNINNMTSDSESGSEDDEESSENTDYEEDANVRRSNRKRQRSVRLPSPDMILPGLRPTSKHKKLKFEKNVNTSESINFDNPTKSTENLVIPVAKKTSTNDRRKYSIVCKTEHPVGYVERLQCPVCPLNYLNIAHVRRHVKFLHPNHTEELTCKLVYVDPAHIKRTPSYKGNVQSKTVRRSVQSKTVRRSVQSKTVRRSVESKTDQLVVKSPLPVGGVVNKIEPKQKIFNCSQCDRSFPRIRALRLHSSVVHRKNIIPKLSYNEMGHQVYTYDCPNCERSYDTLQKVRVHLSNTHRVKKRGEYDSEIFQPGNSSEFFIITKDKRVKCKLCSKQFSLLRFFKQHYKLVHKKAETPPENDTNDNSDLDEDATCSKCFKTFTKLRYLNRHYSIMHGGDNDEQLQKQEPTNLKKVYKFKCPICSRLFQRQQHVDRHVDAQHKKEEPQMKSEVAKKETSDSEESDGVFKEDEFKCPQCGKGFIAKSSLFFHIRSAHDSKPVKTTTKRSKISNRKFKCKQCPKSYLNSRHLERHFSNAHGKYSKKVTCKLCGKVSLNKHAYHSHVYSSHPGETVKVEDNE